MASYPLSNNLIWTAAGFSVYQTCEMNIPKMQPRWWASRGGPDSYFTLAVRPCSPLCHILQTHPIPQCTNEKTDVLLGILWSLWRGITSHTCHWAETESITDGHVCLFPSKEPSSACCLFSLFSFLLLNFPLLRKQLIVTREKGRGEG